MKQKNSLITSLAAACFVFLNFPSDLLAQEDSGVPERVSPTSEVTEVAQVINQPAEIIEAAAPIDIAESSFAEELGESAAAGPVEVSTEDEEASEENEESLVVPETSEVSEAQEVVVFDDAKMQKPLGLEDGSAAEAGEDTAATAGKGNLDYLNFSSFGAFLDGLKLEERGALIEKYMAPIADYTQRVAFAGIDVVDKEGNAINNAQGEQLTIPLVVIWLLLAAVVLTLVFFFINLRGLPLALSTVRGRFSKSSDPGEISHFQALTSAVSGTVGLGNIAGVATAISIGGAGAVFWMLVVGFLGMTTKFCECTLGVKYRKISPKGKVYGGPMYYLSEGLKERDMAGLGRVLATLFAITCAIAAFGGGNMYQVNQSLEQLQHVTGGEASMFAGLEGSMLFGLIVMLVAGSVILCGIKGIGRFTMFLVPIMCVTYLTAASVILLKHAAEIPAALQQIWDGAFSMKAGIGALLGAILMGVRRAAFSNEAGFGSAPIAHAAVRTRYPASEGLVALLEPLLDTVIVCTMTALVILVTGAHETVGEGIKGIALTSAAFETDFPFFKYILSGAAIIFALSTLITWSYYGQQAWAYLLGRNFLSVGIYKIIFLLFILAGAVMSLGAVIDFSDGMLFMMCFFNLIGVYALIPVVKRELRRYKEYVRSVKKGEPLPDGHDEEVADFTEAKSSAAS